MAWNALALTLELRSDLHCGDLPLGFVARTFPYVPCHLPVFAMVAAAVPLLGLPDRHASYKEVETLFLSCVRSTPLYIRHEGRMLFPWHSQSLQDLEHTYVVSRYGVGLDNKSRSAEQGCLYETETILAMGRNCATRTRMEGCLFVREASQGELAMTGDGTLSANGRSASLADLCNAMHLGGNRSRSLGQPARATLAPLPEGKAWGIYFVDVQGQWPGLQVNTGGDAPADATPGTGGPMPLLYAEGGDIISRGVMVLTGRRHTESGAGLGMDAATIAHAPGWQCGKPVMMELANVRYGQLA